MSWGEMILWGLLVLGIEGYYLHLFVRQHEKYPDWSNTVVVCLFAIGLLVGGSLIVIGANAMVESSVLNPQPS